MRPLCDGKLGPNAPLGNLVSNLLRPVREKLDMKIGTELINTEELTQVIEQFNDEKN